MNFKGFLINEGEDIRKYYNTGKVLGLNAVNEIISWTKGVERSFDIDLDIIVKSQEGTIELLNKINDNGYITDNQKSKYLSAVKAYYKYANGFELN